MQNEIKKLKEHLKYISGDIINLYYDIFPITWANDGDLFNMINKIREFIRKNNIKYKERPNFFTTLSPESTVKELKSDDRELIRFSTGKDIHCHKWIIGIDYNNNLYDGYDGIIMHSDYIYDDDNPVPLTKQERLELAEYMIKRWQNFKDAVMEEA